MKESSFLAKWDEVRGAGWYEVSLTRNFWSEKASALGYGFDDRQNGMPVMWSTSSNSYYSVSGWSGESSPSLRFSKDGDNISAEYAESRIVSLSLWCRAKAEGQQIKVEAASGDDDFAEVSSMAVPVDGGVVKVVIPEADRVRVTYERTDGFIVIDDLMLECRTLERAPVEKYTAYEVSEAGGVLLDGLTPATTYGLIVKAVNADECSASSEEVTVTLPEGAEIGKIMMGNEGNSVNVVFDITGRRCRAPRSFTPGVYIVNGVKIVVR